MKKIKKILAVLLSFSIIFSNGWLESFAAEKVHNEYNIEDGEDVATQNNLENATETDAAPYSEVNLLLNYLVVEKPNVTTPDTENVLVGLGDGYTVIENAVLYYRNTGNGAEYQAYVKRIDSDSALFELSLDNSFASGKYTVTAIEYIVNGVSHTIYLQDIGVDASFGVNSVIETEADAYIDEGGDTIDSDAVIVSNDGTVTAQELESAVMAASDGAVKSKSKENIVIVLDPGHGTPDGDPGATYEWNGVTYIERDLNLKIAQYCKEELEKYDGVTVYMTRTTSNNGLKLGAAEGELAGPLVKFAAERDADIFVSIHNNSATVSSANGSEVYYPNANYNPEMSQSTKELSNKILQKLSECGLANRGAKIRDDSGNVQYYPDGSLGDYYGVIRQSKLCGFPGIIIEHAFLTNQADAENHLGSEQSLRKLGQADAKALVEYFGLVKKQDPGRKVEISAFDPGDQSTYILIAENIPFDYDIKNVKFGVWNQGLSDLRWYEGSLDSYGRWLALLPISDYGKSGRYYMDAYITLEDGQFIKIGSSSFEASAPTAKAIYVDNVNKNTGKFDVIVSGIDTASGVASVRIPVWTKNDLSDLHWYMAEKQKDGTYVAHADIKNHKYNYGVYAMQAYIKANNGIETIAASNCYNFEKPTPEVSSFKCDNEFNYILIAENIPRGDLVKSVKFGVWNQGLSDLKWYEAGKDELGRWLAVVGVPAYAKSGTYYGDAYMTLKDGSLVKLGGTSFKVSEPAVDKIYVDNADCIGGTFDIMIEGVNCPSGVESMKVPVWSEQNLGDIYWYDAQKNNDGNYVVHVDIKNHKGNYATYAMQTYIKAKNGVQSIAASTCYTFKQFEGELYSIMGPNGTSVEQMVKYYNSNATYPEFYKTTDAPTIEDFCKIYIEECEAEGVRAEVAFCQAMKETGFLQFGGTVDISQLNFAGLGATDDGGAPASFTSVREGVRAQVQHLKAYASDKPLVNECVDPRFALVTRGTAEYVEWLGIQENPYKKGWASAKNYGYSMRKGYIEILLNK